MRLNHSTRAQFNTSSMQLAGRRYAGAAAGRFLRDWVASTVPQQRWIDLISKELASLSRQIAP